MANVTGKSNTTEVAKQSELDEQDTANNEQAKQLEKEAAESLKQSIGEKTETEKPSVGNATGSSLEDATLANPAKGDLASVQSEADTKFNALLEDELRKKLVEDEVGRRMLAHRQGSGAVNTDNPYNLKAGEKVTYIVNGRAVDANGNSVAVD